MYGKEVILFHFFQANKLFHNPQMVSAIRAQ